MYNKNNIDIVYLWVDGKDPKHREQREAWQKKLEIPTSESNNDHKQIDYEKLRYSLRSIIENTPWIRKRYKNKRGK